MKGFIEYGRTAPAVMGLGLYVCRYPGLSEAIARKIPWHAPDGGILGYVSLRIVLLVFQIEVGIYTGIPK